MRLNLHILAISSYPRHMPTFYLNGRDFNGRIGAAVYRLRKVSLQSLLLCARCTSNMPLPVNPYKRVVLCANDAALRHGLDSWYRPLCLFKDYAKSMALLKQRNFLCR
ncbi:hypothetical protein Zmor_027065 [Zophobas morio]|uniref:Uncharacterized protein n=1 Tax=Zophobas morio TaxID=2755281 RepID=A0AA38M0L2_9CUCU|nr:hypothetical protein Zmor_027065 [Zophobas morio]